MEYLIDVCISENCEIEDLAEQLREATVKEGISAMVCSFYCLGRCELKGTVNIVTPDWEEPEEKYFNKVPSKRFKTSLSEMISTEKLGKFPVQTIIDYIKKKSK